MNGTDPFSGFGKVFFLALAGLIAIIACAWWMLFWLFNHVTITIS